MQKQDQKIGIIGGCGHIGLPLGLVLAKEGFQVTLIDSNEESVGLVSRRIMPFMEADADNLLEEVINNGNLRVTADKSEIKNQNIIFVCIGTPVDEHQSPVPRVFANFLESIKEYLQRDQIMVLRSTVFPGTSDWLEKKLSIYGVDLAFCPERIVQGQAICELYSLPQIISANAQLCEQRVSRVFQTFSPSIVIANFKEAELSRTLKEERNRFVKMLADELVRNKDSSDSIKLDHLLEADLKTDFGFHVVKISHIRSEPKSKFIPEFMGILINERVELIEKDSGPEEFNRILTFKLGGRDYDITIKDMDKNSSYYP